MTELIDLKKFIEEKDEAEAQQLAERGKEVLQSLPFEDVGAVFAFILKWIGENEELQETVQQYVSSTKE